MARLDVRAAIRSFDHMQRYWLGIHEFTDKEDCIFRFAIVKAEAAHSLSDGTFINENDALIELHFWNEHLPAMPDEGPTLAWAHLMSHRLVESLVELALFLRHEESLTSVVAIHASFASGSSLARSQIERAARRFGFDFGGSGDAAGSWAHIYHIFDCASLWGLAWTFNPSALRRHEFLKSRWQLWMSRHMLLSRYGAMPVSATSTSEPILEPHKNEMAAGSDVARQIETSHPPDPVMRRPCADRGERRVTCGISKSIEEQFDTSSPDQRGL